MEKNLDYQLENEVRDFYISALTLFAESNIPFVLGGGIAVAYYTGIKRFSKDLDIFVRHADYTKVLKLFAESGYTTQLYDVRWLIKIFKDGHYIDVIFNTVNNICRVDEKWFERATAGEYLGRQVSFMPPEELIWCKSYVWNRERFDGSDINHILLKCGKTLDWRRLFDLLDPHWHLLLAEIILFQFVYPSDFRDIVPQWLFDELTARAREQYELPAPYEQVCRGPMIDSTQYATDIREWGYKSYTIISV